MLATTKFKQPDMVAHIVSPYIMAGDNTCIQVYYQTQGGTLNIRTKVPRGKPHTGESSLSVCLSVYVPVCLSAGVLHASFSFFTNFHFWGEGNSVA